MKLTKEKVINVFKLVFSLTVIILVLNSLDLKKSYIMIREANIFLLLISFSVPFLITLIITLKWDLLLKTKSIHVSLRKLFYINIISHFWGLFLPSSVSIDILRGYYLSKDGTGKITSASVIILDRVVGIVSLILTAIIGIFLAYDIFENLDLGFYLIIISVPAILFFVIIFNKSFQIYIQNLKTVRLKSLIMQIQKMVESLHDFKKYPYELFFTLLLSLLIQFLRIAHIYFISEAFSTGISISYYVVLVPLIMIIVMIPVSVGGIGVREGGFIGFFSLVGLSTQYGAIISLTSTTIMTIVALLSGVIFLVYKPKFVSEVNLNKLQGS